MPSRKYGWFEIHCLVCGHRGQMEHPSQWIKHYTKQCGPARVQQFVGPVPQRWIDPSYGSY